MNLWEWGNMEGEVLGGTGESIGNGKSDIIIVLLKIDKRAKQNLHWFFHISFILSEWWVKADKDKKYIHKNIHSETTPDPRSHNHTALFFILLSR